MEELSGDSRGRPDSLGKQAGGLGQTFRHHLALAIGIPTPVEHHLDRRQSLAGSGTDRLHVLGAGQQAFERPGDQGFDLSRIETGRFGLQQHVRRREIRKHVEANGSQRSRPRTARSGKPAR